MIVVDSRWRGQHGIARFAGEVVPRLPWRAARATTPTSPTSPLDVLSPWRFALGAHDVVYTPGFNAGVTRARQVLTLHDLIHLDEPAERSRAKALYYETVVKPAVRRAGVVLTVSATSKRRIEQWIGSGGVEVVDVGNGCSPSFLDGPQVAPPAAGRFLYVGNLKPHKHVEVLFQALARRPGYSLTLVTGDGERALALADEVDVVPRVTIRSGLTDAELAELYRAHDGVLLSSRLEGFGLPALEAIATGRRVGFSAGCASVAEIVGDEGVSVTDDGDAEAWAAAMDGLLAAGATLVGDSAAWRGRYEWDAVAHRVAVVLERFTT
ncbi:glycosyltransferase family 4 protein [Amnibacterium sp.]|uniref:glycosyltransferase family 4 protein n=1 Tax=Amnibacterium sp. TaxID=1872496 RepID=UPI003F7C70CD